MRGRNVNTSRQFINFPPLHQARLTKHYKTLVGQEIFFGNKDDLWCSVNILSKFQLVLKSFFETFGPTQPTSILPLPQQRTFSLMPSRPIPLPPPPPALHCKLYWKSRCHGATAAADCHDQSGGNCHNSTGCDCHVWSSWAASPLSQCHIVVLNKLTWI